MAHPQSRTQSSLLIVLVAFVVVLSLLLLCGILAVVGGGLTVCGCLAVSSTAPTPTRFTVALPGSMKTYSNARYRFSVQYPADWGLKEGGMTATFTSPRALTTVTAGAIPEVGHLSEKDLTDLLVTERKTSDPQTGVLFEGTKTFNGVTWRYLLLTGSYNGVETRSDLYAKIHTNGTGYVFVGASSAVSYEEVTQTFTRMMESFRFLP